MILLYKTTYILFQLARVLSFYKSGLITACLRWLRLIEIAYVKAVSTLFVAENMHNALLTLTF